MRFIVLILIILIFSALAAIDNVYGLAYLREYFSENYFYKDTALFDFFATSIALCLASFCLINLF